jgi:hypothetical protein
VAICPQETYLPHPDALLPARPLVQWSFTNMADPRWTWGEKLVLLRQDPQASTPQEIGFGSRQGWGAYLRGSDLFLKRTRYVAGATYPDMGCTYEVFTNGDMLELESLSPMIRLSPGESAEHVEHWFLFGDVKPAATTEKCILEALAPILKETKPVIDTDRNIQ